ncbi:methyl-accepting chemotaxis protein (plasmid) [Erwinia pyri]|uniref:Methyl-accepting chemotaxis protein n=1 Tax=Erwinia pyri TaxID=3062598 RepID=A0AA50DNP4_9GAMM|nr:methyl-accepting chemotaxis protein [Erwinia sp. DE2]WLS81102.1 methyl-accepting chemotaxis protein [Erwinia sp. DE2]
MKRLSIGSYFMDLKVRTKLGLSFSIVIGALIITALVASGCLDTIQDNSARRSLTIEMNSTFGNARLNRTLYQYTNEQEYADKNAEALNKLQVQYQKLTEFSWDVEGKKHLSDIESAMKAYGIQRNILVDYMQRMMEQAARLQQFKYLSLAKEMDLLVEKNAPDPTTATDLQRLSSQLKEINILIIAFTKVPDGKGLKTLITALGAAKDTVNFLNNKNIPILSAVTAPTQDVLGKVLQMISPFEILWSEHHLAAKTLVKKGEAFDASLSRMFDYQKEVSADFIRIARVKIGLISLVAVILSVLFAWRITLSITQPLSDTLAVARKISTGDLSQTVISERKDELGLLMNAVNSMRSKLEEIISNVRNGVSNVNNAASEIAMGNEDLSSRTEEQAAAVVQTAASMEQLTSTVKLNSENAIYASQLASEASSQATQGGMVVSGVINTMDQIRKSSSRISEITQVINGIAFQTNILALNAAVEAARAGEGGRGFAVVAGEVRNLAQRSAIAAKEIESLIKDSVSQVNSGSAQVDTAGRTMQGIIHSVGQVNDIMKEIATASDEQNRGISQISQAMTEMDTTTQQNAALVEQSAAAAGSLQEEAARLEKAVSFFRNYAPNISVEPSFARQELPVPHKKISSVSDKHWKAF